MRNFIKHILVAASFLTLAAFPAVAGNIALDGNLILNSATATNSGANAATCNNKACVVTTESITTAAAGVYSEVIADTAVAAGDICLLNAATAGTGIPLIANVKTTANTITVTLKNVDAAAAFNNIVVISFVCFKH